MHELNSRFWKYFIAYYGAVSEHSGNMYCRIDIFITEETNIAHAIYKCSIIVYKTK